eukprot:CAMPEP_0118921664 /NCGR_PEP_ID=MMETSP1169-20130426/863_1 /TAXON_ID=36882 /ORGANISM="Pyramimonas obovata, Strain CCMP722" /LENGTH=423 /DNA_ID=CAMNT_0006862427 /DNA_START=490 /DNA_END=1761 /DNA_ORIENTATION=+
MVGDFGKTVVDTEETNPLPVSRPIGKASSVAAQGSSSTPPEVVKSMAPPQAEENPDSETPEEKPSAAQEQMLAREKAAEKVVEQQKEHAAVVHGQVPPARAAAPAAGGRHGKGGKVPAGAARSEATDGKAGLAVDGKKPGKKEEGASWEILDNLRMVADGTRLVTHKRQFIVYNETLAHTVLRHWLEYVDGNETLIYHFPRSLFELLPLEEPQWHFKTCAVVGNSGVVLLRENGAEIDAHDAVLRINMAPVRGFEHYVGKKTTFNIVNSHNVRELLQGLRHWTTSPEGGEQRLVMFETASHFARYHLCQPLLKKFPQANPILLNPIFSNRAHRVWVQLKYLLEQKENNQYNRKPMSGFFSVFFALNVCDRVSLYGFDAYTSKKHSYRYHYFDNVQGFTDVHSFDLALEVYKLFAQRGLVNIVT